MDSLSGGNFKETDAPIAEINKISKRNFSGNRRKNLYDYSDTNDSITMCLFAADLERAIVETISGDKFQDFSQLRRDPKMKKELEKKVPLYIQELIYYFIDVTDHISMSFTLESLEEDLRFFRLTKKEIKILWNLIHKYLVKDISYYESD